MPTILIVEDQPNNVEIFTRLFKRSGYDYLVAGNKADAVARATESRPDLILMDIRMPEVEGGEISQTAGIDATRELREKEETREIPIIGLTGDAMMDFKARLKAAGFNDQIDKPVTDFKKFLETLESHMAS